MFLLELSRDDLRQIGVDKKDGDKASQSKATNETIPAGETQYYKNNKIEFFQVQPDGHVLN